MQVGVNPTKHHNPLLIMFFSKLTASGVEYQPPGTPSNMVNYSQPCCFLDLQLLFYAKALIVLVKKEKPAENVPHLQSVLRSQTMYDVTNQ